PRIVRIRATGGFSARGNARPPAGRLVSSSAIVSPPFVGKLRKALGASPRQFRGYACRRTGPSTQSTGRVGRWVGGVRSTHPVLGGREVMSVALMGALPRSLIYRIVTRNRQNITVRFRLLTGYGRISAIAAASRRTPSSTSPTVT